MLPSRFSRLIGLLLCLISLPALTAQDADPTPLARLRVAHYVVDAPDVTVWLNDTVFTTAPLTFTQAAPHAVAPAGTHDLVFMAGDDVLASVTITLAADHDYTAALIGQVVDASARIVLIAETELVGQVRDPQQPASYAILLHGISDGPSVDFALDGIVAREGLAFGAYDIFPITQAPHDIRVTFSDDPSQVLFENSGETPPANDLLLLTVMAGAYPDGLDVTGAVSRLPDRSVIDFLRTAQDANGSGFTTLLEALAVTGLAETLAAEGAYTLFAPTDAAFDALPQATRELLFAYPQALRAVLNGHLVDEVFVLRDLDAPLTLTSREGTRITLRPVGETVQANDSATLLFGGFPVVTNGNVIAVDQLLLPQTK